MHKLFYNVFFFGINDIYIQTLDTPTLEGIR